MADDAANNQQVNAELAKWEGDFPEEDLNIPYKNEAVAEDKKPEEKPAETPDEGKQPVEDPTPVAPEPAVTVEDPGEYTPADYSFEVTNKDGKVVKITSPEEADAFAEDDENFKTAKDLKEFLRQSQKMENNLEKDKATYDDKKAKFDEANEAEQARIESINALANGFDYLVSKGLLPAVDKQYLAADWNDPEVAKQPGVKEQIELVNYMVKENAIRAKAGIDPITSAVDAFNAWKLENAGKQAQDEQRAAGEARKAAGARVAGVSPAQQGTYVPKGIAVGRVLPQRGAAMWDD